MEKTVNVSITDKCISVNWFLILISDIIYLALMFTFPKSMTGGKQVNKGKTV